MWCEDSPAQSCDLGRRYDPFPDGISIPIPVVTSNMPESVLVGKENSHPECFCIQLTLGRRLIRCADREDR
jgi:hypothetical protein